MSKTFTLPRATEAERADTRPTTDNVQLTPQVVAGPEAKGYAIALRLEALVMNHGKELGRITRDLFDADQLTRDAAQKRMGQWQEQCRKNAEAHNLTQWDEEERRKVANTATVRVSQMRTICRALKLGLCIAEVERQCDGRSFNGIGFDLIYKIAAAYANANATKSKGRPKMTAFVKLVNFAKNLTPTDQPGDSQALAVALNQLVSLAEQMGIELPEAK